MKQQFFKALAPTLLSLTIVSGCSVTTASKPSTSSDNTAFRQQLDKVEGFYDVDQKLSYLSSLNIAANTPQKRLLLDKRLAETALGSRHFKRYGSALYNSISVLKLHDTDEHIQLLGCFGLLANGKRCVDDGEPVDGISLRIGNKAEYYCAPVNYEYLKQLPAQQSRHGVWNEVHSFKALCGDALAGKGNANEAFVAWVTVLKASNIAMTEPACRNIGDNLNRDVTLCALARAK